MHPEDEFSLEQPLVDVERGSVSKFCGDGVDEDVCNRLLSELVFEVQRFGSITGGSSLRSSWLPVALLSFLARLSPKPGETINGEPLKYDSRSKLAWCEQQLQGTVTCHTFDFKLGKKLPSLVITVVKGERHEAKWPDALYQVLQKAGMLAAIRNSSVNRLRLVHCLVLGDGWWSSAEIHPFGMVMAIPGNRLTSSSFSEFRSELRCKGILHHRYSSENRNLKAELEERIRSRTKEAARKLNSSLVFGMVVHGDEIRRSFSPGICRRKALLVGKVVYDGEVHSSNILSFPMTRRVSRGDRALLWGLLRIIIGKRVKYWTVPGVEKFLAAREEELRRQAEALVLEQAQ